VSGRSIVVVAPIAIASREMVITRRCTEPKDAHCSCGQEQSLGFSRDTKTRGAIAIPIQTPTTKPTMTESPCSIIVVVPIAIASREMGITRRCTEPKDAH